MPTSTADGPRAPRPVRWPRMRPRFTVEVECGAEDVMDALRSGLVLHPQDVAGELSTRHGVWTVPAAERQFWSTQLGLSVEPAKNGTRPEEAAASRVLGVFSPHPEIWTAYVFAIGTLSVLGVFGAMVAVVQILLGHAPWALLASLISALLGGLVYTTTLVGQGLAADEMYRLRSLLDHYLEAAEARARRTPATARESAQL